MRNLNLGIFMLHGLFLCMATQNPELELSAVHGPCGCCGLLRLGVQPGSDVTICRSDVTLLWFLRDGNPSHRAVGSRRGVRMQQAEDDVA